MAKVHEEILTIIKDSRKNLDDQLKVLMEVEEMLENEYKEKIDKLYKGEL